MTMDERNIDMTRMRTAELFDDLQTTLCDIELNKAWDEIEDFQAFEETNNALYVCLNHLEVISTKLYDGTYLKGSN